MAERYFLITLKRILADRTVSLNGFAARLQNAALPPARQRAALAFLELYESLRYGRPRANDVQGARTALNQLKSLLKHAR